MYGICIAGLVAAYFSRSERQYLVALRIASGAVVAATCLSLVFVAYSSSELSIYKSWYADLNSATSAWAGGLALAAVCTPLGVAATLGVISAAVAQPQLGSGGAPLLGQQQAFAYVPVVTGTPVPNNAGYAYQVPVGYAPSQYPGQYSGQQPGQYQQQPGQYPQQPGQYPQQPGQYPGQY